MNQIVSRARLRVVSALPLVSCLVACAVESGPQDESTAGVGASSGSGGSAAGQGGLTAGGGGDTTSDTNGGGGGSSGGAAGGAGGSAGALSGAGGASGSAGASGADGGSGNAGGTAEAGGDGGGAGIGGQDAGGAAGADVAGAGGADDDGGAGGADDDADDDGGADAGGAGADDDVSGDGPVFHIVMLMGQSNMAGVAPNQASDQNTDDRILIWGGCKQPQGQWNVANPPLNDCPGEKGWNLDNTVGPGMWFAKTLLEKMPEGHTVGMVGTAESGESINTFVSGGSHHAMILRKIDEVKNAENARFSGIIFHQGESDSGQGTWPDKVVQLYDEVKAAFGVDYDVPFILGELPQGGCCGGHNNLIHQAADKLPMGYWVSQEGTNVMDEYHFDHPSVILMGQRYGETMLEAWGW